MGKHGLGTDAFIAIIHPLPRTVAIGIGPVGAKPSPKNGVINGLPGGDARESNVSSAFKPRHHPRRRPALVDDFRRRGMPWRDEWRSRQNGRQQNWTRHILAGMPLHEAGLDEAGSGEQPGYGRFRLGGGNHQRAYQK